MIKPRIFDYTPGPDDEFTGTVPNTIRVLAMMEGSYQVALLCFYVMGNDVWIGTN